MRFGVGYINSVRYNRSDVSNRRVFPPNDQFPVETHLAPEYTGSRLINSVILNDNSGVLFSCQLSALYTNRVSRYEYRSYDIRKCRSSD